MTVFFVSLLLVYLFWWMLSFTIRKFLYTEWTEKPFTTWEHLKGIIPYILRQASPQNIQAQGFVDGELKLLNQRRSFMLLSFQRIGVIFAGIILLATLQIEMLIGLLVLGSLLFGIFFKKPGKGMQVAFVAGAFFMAYQWSFYQASQWIYSSEVSEFVFFMADTKILSILCFLAAGILITLFSRYEFWSLWLTSVLFFAGGISYLNMFGFILGESLGWAIFWWLQAKSSSKKIQIVQREILFINGISAVVFFIILFYLKAADFLEIRIFNTIISKKFSLILGWGLWEAMLTIGLMLWGHFRFQSILVEVTSFESTKIPTTALGQGLLKYRGWLSDQIDFRRKEIERRLISLQSNNKEPGAIPLPLLQKSRVEVESLNRLLGALSKNSV